MSATPTAGPLPRPDDLAPGEHYWSRASKELRHRLNKAIPHELLKELHRKNSWLHAAIAIRQFLILLGASYLAWRFPQPWIWIPAAVVSGWTVFNFTVLLHDALHHAVFNGPHPRGDRFLSLLYAVPSGISASQFTRWHLTHHAELGDAEADPKRHYLSPKINRAWYKLLYFTPALFPIYFRAARRETASYPPELQRRIRHERLATIAFHVAVMAAIFATGGPAVFARVYAVPVFFVFPIAFALNRLGQHYAIDPSDPAKWGSILKPSRFWDFWYLSSAYHLEHHYFPGVPMYKLRRLHFALRPFFDEIGWQPTTYGRLLRGWLIENRAPHTDWRLHLEG
ncbi:MAG TPA: fatty acid desaturase [Thermoanaerobaculia bacterium]|nr:fatty acid desaturase [Thermoanaerobaculia bacterium]